MQHSLVRNEDVPAIDHLSEWNRLVLLPVSHSLARLGNDDEIVIVALVMDLGMACIYVHCD